MFAGQKGSLWNAAGHGDSQEQFHQLMECFPVAVVSGRVSEISPGCTSWGPWEGGNKLTLSSRREAGSTASPSPWLPSRACLKAFQESLLFVETGLHSPKTSIPPPHALSVAASLYFPSLQLKGKSGHLSSTHADDLSWQLTWNAPVRGHTSQNRAQQFSFPCIHRPSCERPLAYSWIPNGIGGRKKKNRSSLMWPMCQLGTEVFLLLLFCIVIWTQSQA